MAAHGNPMSGSYLNFKKFMLYSTKINKAGVSGKRLYRRQVQMMTACAYYAGGFIWGAKNNKDYTPELLRVKEMILNYVKVNA